MRDLEIKITFDSEHIGTEIEGQCDAKRAMVAVGTLIACLLRGAPNLSERQAAIFELSDEAREYALKLAEMEAGAGDVIPGVEVCDMSDYHARPRKEIRQND